MEKERFFSDLVCDYALEKDMREGDELSRRDFGGVRIEHLKIRSAEYEKRLNKRVGDYVSLHFKDICGMDVGEEDELTEALSAELKRFYPRKDCSVLTVGIGNSELVADSVGYRTVRSLNAGGETGIYSIYSDVSGRTGIESADTVRAIAGAVRPDVVIAVDSAVTGSIGRLSRAIQLSDVGLSPGRGLGAIKKKIDSESVECPVVSIGVPTVIDLGSIFRSAFGELGRFASVGEKERIFLTSHSIDVAVGRYAYVIARAIEKSLL